MPRYTSDIRDKINNMIRDLESVLDDLEHLGHLETALDDVKNHIDSEVRYCITLYQPRINQVYLANIGNKTTAQLLEHEIASIENKLIKKGFKVGEDQQPKTVDDS